jgi:hypothetical protein
MRLRFLLEEQGGSGDQAPPGSDGRKFIFRVDPTTVPTVSALADFVSRKLGIESYSKVCLYVGDFLVDRDELISIFDKDDVITVR